MIRKLFSKIRGDGFIIDRNIPSTYLLGLFYSKIVALLWGIIRFHRFSLLFISPSSTIKCSSKIKYGRNFSVGKRCYIDALSDHGLICGDNVSIGFFTRIELTGSLKKLGEGLKIGNNVGLGSHGCFGSGAGYCEIGDNTIFGNYVSIHPENHNYSDPNTPIRLQGVNGKGVKIGKNCWIGAKATILDGTNIGDNCIVAAGAVVKGKFPNGVLIGGVPAKILKKIYQ